MQDATDETTGRPVAAEGRDAAPRIVSSADLLRGGREVIIRHGADDYRLRLTRVGKLILNK